MRKVLILGAKIAAALAVLAAVAAVVGTFALKKYLPPEKVRELITENSRKVLHREVRIKSVDLNAVKGLSLTGLEVSENPDFDAGTFAKADAFQLRVRLMPLLHGSVAVDRLAVSGLRLTVKKGADGKFNFSDITASKPQTEGAKPLPVALDVSHISLSDGQIAYSDAGTGDQLTLSAISAQITDLSLDGDTAADLQFKASGKAGGRPLQAAVAFDGTVNAAKLDLEKASASMKKASVQAAEGKLTVSGTIKGLKAPELDLKTETILGTAAPVQAEVSGKLSELSTNASASLSVKARVPELKPADLAPLGAPKGLAVPPAEAAAQFELAGDLLTLKSFSLKTAAGRVEASGTIDKVRTAPVPSLTVSAKLDAPSLKSSDLSFLKEKVKLPEDLVLPAFKLDAEAGLQADDAVVKSLRFTADGASLEGSGSVRKLRSGSPQPDVTLSLRASAPKITPLLTALMKACKVEVPAGLSARAADIEAQFHYSPAGVDVKSFHLNSQGSVVSASGRVTGLSSGKPQAELDVDAKLALPELTSADLVFLKSYKVDVPAGMTLPKAALDAKLHYAADDVTVSEFRFENAYASAKASGAVRKIRSGKPQGTVNGSASLRMPAVSAKDLAFLKLLPKVKVPDALAWPPTQAEARFRYDGTSVDFSQVHVQSSKIALDGSAGLRGLGGTLSAAADLKTSLPAFTSEDVSFVEGVPPGLKIPAAKIEVRGTASKDAFDLGFLKIESGRNQLTAKGTVKNILSGKPAFNLAVMSSGFVLEDLTDLSPQTREMGLKGVGRFKVFIAQVPSLGNAYTGDMEFRGVRMTVAGIALSDFAGKGEFDKDHVAFPSISGKIDGAPFEMDLSVRDYLRRPAINIQKGTLESVDAGKLLAAKEQFAKKKPEPGEPVPIKPFGLKIWDSFTIGKIVHPYATIEKASLQCDLSGITPDFKQLDGTAKFSTGGGHLTDLDKIAERYPLFKVLALPILIMRGIGLFPNLSDIAFTQLDGAYDITKGVVDVKRFVLDGDKLDISANAGKVDLPGDKVYMDVDSKIGVISKHMVICGKIESPNTNCKNLLQRGVDTVEGAAKLPLNVLQDAADTVVPK